MTERHLEAVVLNRIWSCSILPDMFFILFGKGKLIYLKSQVNGACRYVPVFVQQVLAIYRPEQCSTFTADI